MWNPFWDEWAKNKYGGGGSGGVPENAVYVFDRTYDWAAEMVLPEEDRVLLLKICEYIENGDRHVPNCWDAKFPGVFEDIRLNMPTVYEQGSFYMLPVGYCAASGNVYNGGYFSFYKETGVLTLSSFINDGNQMADVVKTLSGTLRIQICVPFEVVQ